MPRYTSAASLLLALASTALGQDSVSGEVRLEGDRVLVGQRVIVGSDRQSNGIVSQLLQWQGLRVRLLGEPQGEALRPTEIDNPRRRELTGYVLRDHSNLRAFVAWINERLVPTPIGPLASQNLLELAEGRRLTLRGWLFRGQKQRSELWVSQIEASSAGERGFLSEQLAEGEYLWRAATGGQRQRRLLGDLTFGQDRGQRLQVRGTVTWDAERSSFGLTSTQGSYLLRLEEPRVDAPVFPAIGPFLGQEVEVEGVETIQLRGGSDDQPGGAVRSLLVQRFLSPRFSTLVNAKANQHGQELVMSGVFPLSYNLAEFPAPTDPSARDTSGRGLHTLLCLLDGQDVSTTGYELQDEQGQVQSYQVRSVELTFAPQAPDGLAGKRVRIEELTDDGARVTLKGERKVFPLDMFLLSPHDPSGEHAAHGHADGHQGTSPEEHSGEEHSGIGHALGHALEALGFGGGDSDKGEEPTQEPTSDTEEDPGGFYE